MANARVLYVDVDGTLVGPGGDLFWDRSTALAEALLAARAAELSLVPVTGRGRVQVRELCRLLGLPRGIGELGCIHLEGNEVRYELGLFPFVGETPVEAMVNRGPLNLVRVTADLEPHDPWNEGREATLILRGQYDGIASMQDLLKFFEKLPNPDKQFAVMPGIAHASIQQKNYAIVYHILSSFFSQPEPIYRGE